MAVVSVRAGVAVAALCEEDREPEADGIAEEDSGSLSDGFPMIPLAYPRIDRPVMMTMISPPARSCF
jgi:hypothetical protein